MNMTPFHIDPRAGVYIIICPPPISHPCLLIYLVPVDMAVFLALGEDSADTLILELGAILSLDDDNSLLSPSVPFAPTPLSPS